MEFKTSDIGIAGYLLTKKVKLKKVDLVGRDRKRAIFVFENKEESAKKIATEFANTEFKVYDSNIRLIKLMAKEELQRME